jgi:hypothetical protein
VSKHTTCDDVDEDGVKRLGEVPVCRCHHRDVDVGAVLLGTNKAHKNRNPNTHVNAQKFEAKRIHKSCLNLCQDNAKFCVKGSNRCQNGDYGVKMRCQNEAGGCTPALAGMGRLFPDLWMRAWEERGQGEVG